MSPLISSNLRFATQHALIFFNPNFFRKVSLGGADFL